MQSPTTRKKKELIEFITTHEVSNPDNSKNKLGRKPSVVLESEKLDNEFVIEIRIKYWKLQFLLKLCYGKLFYKFYEHSCLKFISYFCWQQGWVSV